MLGLGLILTLTLTLILSLTLTLTRRRRPSAPAVRATENRAAGRPAVQPKRARGRPEKPTLRAAMDVARLADESP